MSEQPLDIKSFSKVVRRRRRMVGAFAALGLAAGVAHWVVMPPEPTARALVVLPASTMTGSSAQSAATPAQEMSTQVIIATSTPVLAAAGKAVSPTVSPEALKRDVSVSAPGTDVLQFDVDARRAAATPSSLRMPWRRAISPTSTRPAQGPKKRGTQRAPGRGHDAHGTNKKPSAADKYCRWPVGYRVGEFSGRST